MDDESQASRASLVLQAIRDGFLINGYLVCDCGDDRFHVGMLTTEYQDFVRCLMCANCMKLRHLPFKRERTEESGT